MTEDKREQKRVAVVLRIKLRYQDLGTFIDKFAINLSRGGMFIASRAPKAVGTTIRFELRLADKSTVVAGEGVVRWIRGFDEENPRALHGMGIEFTKLADGSQEVLDQVVEYRHELGLTDDLAIPRAVKASGSKPTPGVEKPTPPSSEPAPPKPEETAAPPPKPPEDESAAETASDAPLSAQAAPSASEQDLMDFIDGATESALTRARRLARSALAAAEADEELDALLKVTATPAAESFAQAASELRNILDRPGTQAQRANSSSSADGLATIPESPAFEAQPTIPGFEEEEEEEEEEEGETVIASQKGARRLMRDGNLDSALDALEAPGAPTGTAESSPVIASAPNEAQLEAALSEIDDSDLGFAATLDEESRDPGMAATIPDTIEAPQDDDEPGVTYSAPLDAAALSPEALSTEVDIITGEALPDTSRTRSDDSSLDATIAALEFDDVDIDFDDD